MKSQLLPQSQHILLVDDDRALLYAFSNKLRAQGYAVDEASSFGELQTKLSAHQFEFIILDDYLTDGRSLPKINDIVTQCPSSKVIMFSGRVDGEAAAEALNQGATDYIPKDKSIGESFNRIITAIRNSLGASKNDEVEIVRNDGIIARSKAMQDVLREAKKAAASDVTVVIQGESGTGKELVARAIHEQSPRARRGIFTGINCAAIAENLLEAELFGSVRGAFTDSRQDRKGFFQTSHNGTLFLDEVGDMPLTMQAKLLRVLQEKEVIPVGSYRPIAVDTRIVVATHRDLYQEMKLGRFRADLYYRLDVVHLAVPSLRERREDIPVLIDFYIQYFCQQFGKNYPEIHPSVIEKLTEYAWPGNVRELRNAAERAVALMEHDRIDIHNFLTRSSAARECTPKLSSSSTLQLELNFHQAQQQFLADYMSHLLQSASGNISYATKLSGLHRPGIYRLMKRLGLNAQSFKQFQNSADHLPL